MDFIQGSNIYDSSGRLIRCEGNYFNTDYFYDQDNHLIKLHRIPINQDSFFFSEDTITYQYDALGRVSKLFYSGGGSEYTESYSYEYSPYVIVTYRWSDISHTTVYLDLGYIDAIPNCFWSGISDSPFSFFCEDDLQITTDKLGRISSISGTYNLGRSSERCELYYSDSDVSHNQKKDSYASYASAVTKAINLHPLNEEEYAYGILADLDNDGTEEMLLNYCVNGENGFSFTVYSVYDYENGKLKTIVDQEKIVAHVAASYGHAGVVTYKGSPTILVCSEDSNGTGPGTTHWYDDTLYNYPTVSHCVCDKPNIV